MSYIALATTTLTTAASSVTFSSIPTSVNGVALRDLILVINAAVTAEGVPRARVNGDAASNYSRVEMFAGNVGIFSSTATQGFFDLGRSGTGSSGTRFMCVTQFMDYSATDKHKTVLSRNNDDDTRALSALAQRWANTAAITSITCILSANSYATGSTFSLYGIAG